MDDDFGRFLIKVINKSQGSTSKPFDNKGISRINLGDYHLLSARVRGMGEGFQQQIAVFLKSFLQNLGYARPSLQEACEYWMSQENSIDGFYVKDLTGTYVFVNPAMASILERTPSELVGLKDNDVLEEQEADICEDIFNKALQGELVQSETERTINNKRKMVSEVLVAKRGRDYQPVGVYGICREVFESRYARAQKELLHPYSKSPAMRETMEQCAQVAETDSTVLLLGESGSGKDYLAKNIHHHSKRREKPYQLINCGAITETLVESELFGYEKGAFTGAIKRKKGLLEWASTGTAFLNEIGELALPSQSKILSFLDTKRFQRVGGQEDILVDVRLIAATNRELRREVANGKFRKDLYYRLNVFTIYVPPLRERLEDIPMLTEHLLATLSKEKGLSEPQNISGEAMQKLCSYSWPGNVRELRNVLERALVLSHGTELNNETVRFNGDIERSDKRMDSGNLKHEQENTTPRTEKPDDAELRKLFSRYVSEQKWTRARLAAHLNVDSSTLKKWFKDAGLPAGKAGRPKKKPGD